MSETPDVLEQPSKPSKLSRIKSNAIMAGIYIVPVALAGGSMYVTTRNAKIALETAKLNLEAAKLNKS
jgi:D-aminopeptidase